MSMLASTETGEYVVPTEGKYNSSIFSKIITCFSIILTVAVILGALYGVLYLLVAYIQFQDFNAQVEAAKKEYNEYLINYLNEGGDPDSAQPFNYIPTDAQGNFLNPTQTLRTGIFMIIGALLFGWLVNKFYAIYGEKSIELNDVGIKITTLRLGIDPNSPIKLTLRPTKLIPWDSVLDIVVKKSDSIFSTFNSRVQKAVIYTMDSSISIEGLAFGNQNELMDKLRAFGESLEERVIDFGYGAQLAVVWRRMKRSKVGVLGMVIVTFFTIVALLAAVLMTIYPFDTLTNRQIPWTPFGIRNPNYLNLNAINHEPSITEADGSPGFLFGTDDRGRDFFARVFFGSFYSILIGLIATIIAVVLGGFIGAASGYLGGIVDNITMRIADVLMVLPGLPILIMIGATFTPVFKTLDIEGAYYIVVFSIFALISWSGTARYVRAEVLALKESEYIQAEHILGASHYRIITKHILPNTLSTIIIIFTLGVAGNIQAVASLAFLGFGSSSTLVWGDDLAAASSNPNFVFSGVWWGVTFVSLALFLLTLGFNLMGDALRDALDPRLKE